MNRIPGDYQWHYEDIPSNFDLHNIKKDTVVLIIHDNLCGDNHYKWGSNQSPNTPRLTQLFDRHSEKRFIVFSSLENLHKEIHQDNVYIIPIGGCITKQCDLVPNIKPVWEKNLESGTSFICLNRLARISRVLSVNYIYGNDLDKFAILTHHDSAFKTHYLDLIDWKFDTRHLEDQKILEQGYEKLVRAYEPSSFIHTMISRAHGLGDYIQLFEDLRSRYENSFIEIVTEPTFPEPAFLMTEKYLNSIYACNFPIMIGSQGVVKFLRDFGFDVFDDVIDHSYDDIENPIDRIFAAYKLNMSLLKDVDRVKQLWVDHRDRFLANVDFAKKDMYLNYEKRATDVFLKFGLDQ
jgi:hypothetical protein